MIYTGYYAKVKEYESNGLTPVGISGWTPDWYKGKTYKKLAQSILGGKNGTIKSCQKNGIQKNIMKQY